MQISLNFTQATFLTSVKEQPKDMEFKQRLLLHTSEAFRMLCNCSSINAGSNHQRTAYLHPTEQGELETMSVLRHRK